MSQDPSNTTPSNESSKNQSSKNRFLGWLTAVLLLYILIVAVSLISRGFRAAVGDYAEDLFAFADNPFLGLMVGIISTALIQSSSSTTSIIVSLVAGGLPVVIAIPMIMGANLGTSVTNTLVSIGYLANKEEFKLAFSAATVLDLFNVLAVIIFFSLEERIRGTNSGTNLSLYHRYQCWNYDYVFTGRHQCKRANGTSLYADCASASIFQCFSSGADLLHSFSIPHPPIWIAKAGRCCQRE